MRKEWEEIQGDPSQMSESLKNHLKMLDEIGKGEPANLEHIKNEEGQTNEQLLAEFQMIHSVAS